MLQGTTVTVRCRFRNSAGQLADPTTVRATVTAPDGSVTVFEYGQSAQLTRDSLGVFELELPLAMGGTYGVVFQGRGAVAVVARKEIKVTPIPTVIP